MGVLGPTGGLVCLGTMGGLAPKLFGIGRPGGLLPTGCVAPAGWVLVLLVPEVLAVAVAIGDKNLDKGEIKWRMRKK